MDVVIRKAELQDLDLLMRWRMEVLHEVFSIPADQPLAELEAENRRYYQKELPQGGHIACFVYIGEAIVGCGGMCPVSYTHLQIRFSTGRKPDMVPNQLFR